MLKLTHTISPNANIALVMSKIRAGRSAHERESRKLGKSDMDWMGASDPNSDNLR
jgi:hypothetical protein